MLLRGGALRQGLSRLFSSQGSAQEQPVVADVDDQVDSAHDTTQQRLTKQQQQELKAALLSSFQKSPSGSAGLIVKSLDEDAKRELMIALERTMEPLELSRTAMVEPVQPPVAPVHQAAAAAESAAEIAPPTFPQLMRVAVTRGIPFVAFGFFDNMIMITAGEQIDLMFGAKLGLSSMAAAGLGNTVADVVGINISHTIEQKFKHMKSMAPQLTKAQMKLPQAKRASWLGCALGMAIGCLLGLTPLLFYDDAQHTHASSSAAGSRDSSSDSSSSSSSRGKQAAAGAG